MTDNTENLVWEHLKALRSELKDMRAAMHGEFKDVKARLRALEAGRASVVQHIGHLGSPHRPH
jgi:hypothetical protein